MTDSEIECPVCGGMGEFFFETGEFVCAHCGHFSFGEP